MHLVSKTAKRLFFLHSRFCISSTGVLGGSCISRYKSLYSQLTEADHANLQGLASDLYCQNKTKFRILKLPDEIKIPSESLIATPLGKDFSEIHESTVSYGSPELEDQNSGAIYMHASIHEDKSSKAIRVSDEMFQLNDDQIQACLELSFHWPLNTVSQSWTLQKVVQSLDSVCHQRILQETWESNDQLYRVAYLMSLNLLKVKHTKFLHHFVINFGEENYLKTQEELILYLLISAFTKPSSNMSEQNLKNLMGKVESNFDESEAVELAVSYAGLSTLSSGHPIDLTKLKNRIESRFGFRLN